jgi:hypothetical protein
VPKLECQTQSISKIEEIICFDFAYIIMVIHVSERFSNKLLCSVHIKIHRHTQSFAFWTSFFVDWNWGTWMNWLALTVNLFVSIFPIELEMKVKHSLRSTGLMTNTGCFLIRATRFFTIILCNQVTLNFR